MASEKKLGSLCQALLIAASVTALSAGAAHAQQGDELGDLSGQILDNPQDAALNLRYAHAAEAAGKPRLALAAYERVMINDPSNADARAGYERVRRQLEPGYTIANLEVGVRWDSDPANVHQFSPFERLEGTTQYAQLMVANEHQFVGARWRTNLNLDWEQTQNFAQLNYDYAGLQTGPIFYLGPHLAALPAVGVSAAWLNGHHYYNEASVSLGVEGRGFGGSYWARVREGWRDYDAVPLSEFFFSTIAESGNYTELTAGYARPHVLFERGSLTVAPFARWSDIKGDVFDFWIFDELSPGRYTEYGADVNYNYQISDHLTASVGAYVRKREFTDTVREDDYLSPQASLVVQRVLPCNCDVRVQYRQRDNDSNELISDYHAEQVSLSLTARF